MKTYLIIGASSGIGKATALSLAENGFKVLATFNSTTPNYEHSNISFHKLDVLGECDLTFLPETLDGLAYCPGLVNLKPFARLKLDDFKADFDLQVGGAIKCIQAALPALKAAGNASIVLFSTVAVQSGFNFHSLVSTSKGAIEGLSRALAAEFAPKIRVNCVAPSLTETPLVEKMVNSEDKIEANAQRHPLKRIGKPEDMAEAAAFLLSDRSSWMTAQVLTVDGGISSLKS